MKVSETPEFQGLKDSSNILSDEQRKADVRKKVASNAFSVVELCYMYICVNLFIMCTDFQ